MFRLLARTLVVVALLVGTQTWLVAQSAQPAKRPAAKAAAAKTETATPAPAVVNLNSATAEQLDSLPGIGPAVASRIIEYRQKNGPFKKIEDLMNVRGVGEKSFLKIRNRLTVAPAKPAVPDGQ